MVDLNGLDWWADCIQTAPNPLKPDSVYAVCGPEILDLPEGRGAPQLLGTLSALGEIHVCVLQHFQPAIIVASEKCLPGGCAKGMWKNRCCFSTMMSGHFQPLVPLN